MPRQRRGHVPKAGTETLVGFRIPIDRYACLQELSRRQRYTIAELINQALEAKFELAKLARIAKEKQLELPQQENLVTCPGCGTPNFTVRGLKAHACKGKKR